jgi:nucleotide-binding universal stress UspA family protein
MSGKSASRPVVVGVDGSRESEAALRFGADEATLRGVVLRIVCAWEPSASGYVGAAFAPTPDAFEAAEVHAEAVLGAALRQLQGEQLEIEAIAEEGGPAGVLLEQAADAALLVVGSRGLGAAERLLLGSVSQQLAQKASCPIVIVRP